MFIYKIFAALVAVVLAHCQPPKSQTLSVVVKTERESTSGARHYVTDICQYTETLTPEGMFPQTTMEASCRVDNSGEQCSQCPCHEVVRKLFALKKIGDKYEATTIESKVACVLQCEEGRAGIDVKTVLQI